ncbi:hypothetical protein Lesp02_03340 [Lentzea sp. NBRC 105346]|uniref:hypothetical protein n=1 Tax=Lentzea sp. NBRC 105346 TaxID=3032205 RepID=UPI0024A499E9|nr:hypothetical protein [Lentzea sp. NBRC 105346]GLZ28144.1 hypothetical protein Lesp02_03340 [Lentzea sp. NBRC 105346]
MAPPGERQYEKTGVRSWPAAFAGWAGRVRTCSPRPLRWLLADPQRLVTLAWLIGLLIVGHARAALADDIIVGPDLARGAPKTLFETYGFVSYGLTVKPDEGSEGWLDIGQVVWQTLGLINLLILWLCLGVLYGALTLLEWLLHLTIYADSAGPIDQAVTTMASTVFFPLITATVAIGAFTSYAQWRGEGKGFVSDIMWVIAAAALGIAFASGPSQIMTTVDGLRQNLANGVMTGAAKFVNQQGNPVGFPNPQIGGAPNEASTRKLVDGVWSTFGATSWCYAQFSSLEVCKTAGAHALANDETWQRWMQVLEDEGDVPEFGPYGHYIRGQDPARLGMLLVIALITLPMAWLLLRLVIAGLTAVAGFLLMLCVASLFLVLWPIQGWPRTIGIRTIGYTIGTNFQALFVTVTVSGVAVVTVVISTLAGKYGYFAVGVLNIALMNSATKIKAWMDNLIGEPAPRTMGIASLLIMRSLVRTVPKVIGIAASGGAGLAAAAAGAAGKAALRTITGPSPLGFKMHRESGLDAGPPTSPPGTDIQPRGPRTSYPPLGELTGGPSTTPAASKPATPHYESRHAFQAPAAWGPWEASPTGDITRQQLPNTTERRWTISPVGREITPPDPVPLPATKPSSNTYTITDAKPPRPVPPPRPGNVWVAGPGGITKPRRKKSP